MKLNVILEGDCLKILPTVAEKSIDLVVTSPPYVEKRKKSYGGIPVNKYKDWLIDVSVEIMRVLKDTGSFVLNVKEGCTNGVRDTYVLEYLLEMSKRCLWVDTYIWHKTNPLPTGSKKRLKDSWEHCFHFAKSSNFKFFPNQVLEVSKSKWANDGKNRKNKGSFHTKNGSGINMSRRVVSDLVRPGNVILGSKSCANTAHPAVFPPYLPEFFIKLLTEPTDVVLDPFSGSGTTLVAAAKNERMYVGIEVIRSYVNLARSSL